MMPKIKKLAYGFILLYVMIGASLYFLQEKLIFLPTTLPQDYQYEFQHNFEELFLNAEDGAVINALHFKVEKPKGVILYFHGNAGDLSRWGNITSFFAEKQYDVFVMDYRTYGKSTGILSEKALFSDAQLCYNYVLNHYKEDDVTLYGRSLGTGIAAHLASKNKPKQLILETPYYSLLEVAKKRFPIFPVASLLKYKVITNEFINDVNCLITIFHGTSDTVVPFDSGKRLYDVIDSKDKIFVEIEGGEHNNLIEFEDYHKTITIILD